MKNKSRKINNRISYVFHKDQKKQLNKKNIKYLRKNFAKKKQIEIKTFKMIHKEKYLKQKNKSIKQKKQMKNKKKELTQMFKPVIH